MNFPDFDAIDFEDRYDVPFAGPQYVCDAKWIWPALRLSHSPHYQTLAAPLIELALVEQETPSRLQERPTRKKREKDTGLWKRAQPVVSRETTSNPSNKKKTKPRGSRSRGVRGGSSDDEEEDGDEEEDDNDDDELSISPQSLSLTEDESLNTAPHTAPTEKAASNDVSVSEDNCCTDDVPTQRNHIINVAPSTAVSSPTETEEESANESLSSSHTPLRQKPPTPRKALIERRPAPSLRDERLVFRTLDAVSGEYHEITYSFRVPAAAHTTTTLSQALPGKTSDSDLSVSDVTDGDADESFHCQSVSVQQQ